MASTSRLRRRKNCARHFRPTSESVRRVSALAIVALVCFTLSTSAAFAETPSLNRPESSTQWTRFRGPNGSGLSDAEIPAQWTEKNFAWKTALPGGGNSSPVVWGDRIFLTCADENTGEQSVVCVSADHGAILWKRSYPSKNYRHHAFNSYASSTPAVDEKHVYVCCSTPDELTMLALDHEGKDLWRRSLGGFVSQHGGGQSPIVYQDKVIIGDDQEGPSSFLFALNAETGADAWTVNRKTSDKFAPATPCVFQPAKGPEQLIFASKPQGFTAVDPADGSILWEMPSLFDARPIASPYVSRGLIFGSCGDGAGGHLFAAVRPDESGRAAKIAYSIKKSAPYVPTSLVKDGLLFAVSDNGMLCCYNVDTGASLWKQRLDGNFYGSFVCARDTLFILSKEGEAFAISASSKFQLLARNELKVDEEGAPPLSSTPAIANGAMYLRTYRHLLCIKEVR